MITPAASRDFADVAGFADQHPQARLSVVPRPLPGHENRDQESGRQDQRIEKTHPDRLGHRPYPSITVVAPQRNQEVRVRKQDAHQAELARRLRENSSGVLA